MANPIKITLVNYDYRVVMTRKLPILRVVIFQRFIVKYSDICLLVAEWYRDLNQLPQPFKSNAPFIWKCHR